MDTSFAGKTLIPVEPNGPSQFTNLGWEAQVPMLKALYKPARKGRSLTNFDSSSQAWGKPNSPHFITKQERIHYVFFCLGTSWTNWVHIHAFSRQILSHKENVFAHFPHKVDTFRNELNLPQTFTKFPRDRSYDNTSTIIFLITWEYPDLIE